MRRHAPRSPLPLARLDTEERLALELRQFLRLALRETLHRFATTLGWRPRGSDYPRDFQRLTAPAADRARRGPECSVPPKPSHGSGPPGAVQVGIPGR